MNDEFNDQSEFHAGPSSIGEVTHMAVQAWESEGGSLGHVLPKQEGIRLYIPKPDHDLKRD